MRNAQLVNLTLWATQWFLGLFFVLASGAPKLVLPFVAPNALPMPLPLPLWFVLVIGTLEVLGGLGLILPGLFRLQTHLTPLAAAGLALVTEGATVYNLAAGLGESAAFAVGIGILALGIAYGRWRVAPLRPSSYPKAVLATAR